MTRKTQRASTSCAASFIAPLPVRGAPDPRAGMMPGPCAVSQSTRAGVLAAGRQTPRRPPLRPPPPSMAPNAEPRLRPRPRPRLRLRLRNQLAGPCRSSEVEVGVEDEDEDEDQDEDEVEVEVTAAPDTPSDPPATRFPAWR